jgi:general stress protein 26
MDESSNEYDKVMSYIDAHPVAVLSTINSDGTPHSAVVYVVTASHHTICFITRNLTRKYQNLYERSEVSIAIYDERDSSTLQATGKAFVANNDNMLEYVLDKISKIHAERADWQPPIKKLRESGDYVVIGIELSTARLAEYQGLDAEGSDFFTEYKPD